jgi:hypothetical protein
VTANWRRLVAGTTLVLMASLAACSSPTEPNPPPPAPPVNNPPVITSIQVAVMTRTEVETDISVTATVTDAETTVAALGYVWAANVGSVSGSGPTVTWRLPKGGAPTPATVTIRLTVVEPFQTLENGVLINREHRVEAAAAPFRVHDSDAEVRALALTFLGKFVDNEVSAADAVSDFSDSCEGKLDELADVQNIRNTRMIFASSFSVSSVAFDSTLTAADIAAPCHFESIVLADNSIEIADGTCMMTAIYETDFWKLCTSTFDPNEGSMTPSAVAFWRSRGLSSGPQH